MLHFVTPYEREFPAFGSLSTLIRDMDRWFREAESTSEQTGAWPRVQARNDANGYELNVDLPGLSVDDVRLDVHRGVLTLSGERQVRVPEGYRVVRRERATTRFSRSIQLPEDVDAEAVQASMKDGLLTIRLPKRGDVQPKRIQIAVK